MPKKRKSETPGLEDGDKTLFSSFCAAANSLSQLYSQAQNQQRVAFQSGERHALSRLQQWLTSDQGAGGSNSGLVSKEQILDFIQGELDRMDDGPPLGNLCTSQRSSGASVLPTLVPVIPKAKQQQQHRSLFSIKLAPYIETRSPWNSWPERRNQCYAQQPRAWAKTTLPRSRPPPIRAGPQQHPPEPLPRTPTRPASSRLPSPVQEHLPWIMKSAHEKPYEEELKRRILALSQRPEEFLYGELDPSLLIDMRQATLMAASVLQVDEELRQLRLRFVPRVMKEQEFWRRYFVAVKAVKHQVLTQPLLHPHPEQPQQAVSESQQQQQQQQQQRGINASAPSTKSLISSFSTMTNAGGGAAAAAAAATTGMTPDMSRELLTPADIRGTSGRTSSVTGGGGDGGGTSSGGGSGGKEHLISSTASLKSGGSLGTHQSAQIARDNAAAGATAVAGGGGAGGGEGGGGESGLPRTGSGRRSMSFSGNQPWASPPAGRPLSPGKQRPPVGRGRSDKERAMRRSLAREESVDDGDVEDAFLPISVPSSVTIRRLAQALNMARAFATVEDMA
ncbi:unnamed protein product, partial [Closterium sp. Yama58-4]